MSILAVEDIEELARTHHDCAESGPGSAHHLLDQFCAICVQSCLLAASDRTAQAQSQTGTMRLRTTAPPAARALSKSQFPVFTIYAQKSCLGVKPCERAWCFDRVQGYKLSGYDKKHQTTGTRQDCLELCLGEREFTCRGRLDIEYPTVPSPNSTTPKKKLRNAIPNPLIGRVKSRNESPGPLAAEET
ncbi:hypothetical protein J6590_012438 [Homalodisca vitripennis]|nr:hypothetical protein J6590_012438 [Homalodisca vitripennis]